MFDVIKLKLKPRFNHYIHFLAQKMKSGIMICYVLMEKLSQVVESKAAGKRGGGGVGQCPKFQLFPKDRP